MTGWLGVTARHGRLLLVAGLVAGVTLPALAERMAPFLPALIGALLFLAVLRIGPAQMLGTLGDTWQSLRVIALLQLVVPMAICGLLAAFGILNTPAGMALALLFAGAPLSGSPNLTILAGFDPKPALRLVILGTALVPLTALLVFWVLPGLSGGAAVVGSALRLLAVIGGAAVLALAARKWLLPDPGQQALAAIDGLSAIVMAVVVVALMSAVGPLLLSAPQALVGWMALAFAANIGAQIVTAGVMRAVGAGDESVPVAIVAGNRNVALFLVSLPPSEAAELLIFIGCYQVPMYLTPLLMPRFYRCVARRSG
ncbi:MAG: hypothetical protein AAGB05_04890 [Pseudomonadota bacterium]